MNYQPINNWTKETILNHIETNFKGKSLLEHGLGCAYRGENETKCAVGLFIPDEKYKKNFEGYGVVGILKDDPSLRDCLPLNEFEMDSLQRIHDQSNPESTKEQLLQWVKDNVKGEENV